MKELQFHDDTLSHLHDRRIVRNRTASQRPQDHTDIDKSVQTPKALMSRASKEKGLAVRFAPVSDADVRDIPHHRNYTKEERIACWWSVDEEQRIKDVAQVSAMALDEDNDDRTDGLNEAYRNLKALCHELYECIKQGPSPKVVIDEEALLFHPEFNLDGIEEWCGECSHFRGLEMAASQMQRESRNTLIYKYRAAILRKYEKGIEGKALSKKGRHMSTRARIWARAMGHADQQAAQEVYSE